MKRHILFIIAVLLTACAPHPVYHPQDADLLFVTAGSGDFSQAISDATFRTEDLGFSHVAIVFKIRENAYVVEATDQKGVAVSTLADFLQRAPQINGKPGVVVKRIPQPDFNRKQAVKRARQHIGEPYDWSFLPDNGKMYCSELVYESFLNANGTPLFSTVPMNFRAPDGSMPAFWTDLFNALNEPVPEGLPGTNPNAMARDTILKEIYRFF